MKKTKLGKIWYKSMGQSLKHPQLMGISALEKGVSIGTPIAAAATVGAKPEYNIAEKVLYGPLETMKAAYTSIAAYAENAGIRDFMNGAGAKGLELIANAGENIYEHPQETIMAAGLALIGGYLTKKGIGIGKDSLKHKYAVKDGYL